MISILKDFKIFRDDLYPSLGGGNKGRKMNFIGKKVISDKYDSLVTTGGIQSNHCRAVAVFAAQHHLQCTLVLHGNKKQFECESGNAKIMRLSGAKIVFAHTPSDIGGLMDQAVLDFKEVGLKPYYIWGGGHTMEGGLAYIEAIKELREYADSNNWIPDYIFLASGTGSTQAGILAGLDKLNLSAKVIGISVGRARERAEQVVHEFYNELCTHYAIQNSSKEVTVLDNYLCGGYGKYNEEIEDLSLNSLKAYGFTLDTTYTAKAFYGMQDYIKKNNIQGNILFWHTGGILNFLAEDKS